MASIFSHTTKGKCWKSTDLWVSVQKWTMPTGKPIEVCLHHPTCVPSSLLLAQRPISVATFKQIPLEENIAVAFMMSFHQVWVLSNISTKQDNPTTRFNDVKIPNLPWIDREGTLQTSSKEGFKTISVVSTDLNQKGALTLKMLSRFYKSDFYSTNPPMTDSTKLMTQQPPPLLGSFCKIQL